MVDEARVVELIEPIFHGNRRAGKGGENDNGRNLK
jgi:hypothetical protein